MRRRGLAPSRHINRKRSGQRAVVSASRWLGGAFEKAIEAKGFPEAYQGLSQLGYHGREYGHRHGYAQRAPCGVECGYARSGSTLAITTSRAFWTTVNRGNPATCCSSETAHLSLFSVTPDHGHVLLEFVDVLDKAVVFLDMPRELVDFGFHHRAASQVRRDHPGQRYDTAGECHRSRLHKDLSVGHGSIASAPSSVAI